VRHQVRLADRRVARVVRRCAELAGQELFQYADADGTVHRIDSADVNAWLAETADVRVTAKDFRTWRGSLLALALTLAACADGAPACWAQDVLKGVARRPGNTPAVCKKAYIHSRVLALGDALVTTLRAPPCAASREPAATGPSQRLAD
jgi:DNA topoisomerase-1